LDERSAKEKKRKEVNYDGTDSKSLPPLSKRSKMPCSIPFTRVGKVRFASNLD